MLTKTTLAAAVIGAAAFMTPLSSNDVLKLTGGTYGDAAHATLR